MKKIFLIMLALSVICISPSKASAADITVGAATWYTWWDMEDGPGSIDPTFLYGPALSAKFSDDFSLSFVFLYGKFDFPNPDGESGTNDLSRMDSDLALNYRLNDYLKIFVGGKYMSFKMSFMEHLGYGPGAGISFVLPAGSNFFILGNVSALYLWGSEKQDGFSSSDYKEYGMNSSLSIAYYIVPASVTLSLGGRYQMLKTVFDEEDADAIHQFYGITAAATYSFKI